MRAAVYRKQRVPVVMGGIHASLCPDAALQFGGAIVIGEVESVWHSVLEDALLLENGGQQALLDVHDHQDGLRTGKTMSWVWHVQIFRFVSACG